MNLPRQALQKVCLARNALTLSHSYSCVYVWVRDLKPGGQGRGSTWHLQSRPQTQNGILGVARTCLCRFTGKTGELKNGCLTQTVFSKLEKHQVWLFWRISAFPVQALGYLDCVDYFPRYLGCNLGCNLTSNFPSMHEPEPEPDCETTTTNATLSYSTSVCWPFPSARWAATWCSPWEGQ